MKYKIFFGILFLTLITIFVVPENKKDSNLKDEQEVLEIEKTEESVLIKKFETPKVSNLLAGVVEREKIDTSNLGEIYEVLKVVDGDTLDVLIDGKVERLRLIGINTPETVDPRKPVECFGLEASNKAKELLGGKRIYLEEDVSQGDRDKYQRLLRYVFLEDGTNFNLLMVKEGFAYEYTYNLPYKYQADFKEAQTFAEENKAGLWGEVCGGGKVKAIPVDENTNKCSIKGNIGSKGDKIYHVEGCGSYEKTVINESQGEKWFCSEDEAVTAGWRKAINCE